MPIRNQVDFGEEFIDTLVMKFLFFSFFVLLICHCTSAPKMDLRKIALNSSKGDVLHILGSPQRTYFKEGTLRWVYLVPEKSGTPIEKEVWFKEGLVVFVDSPGIKRKDTADTQIQFTPVD
jgi:hypothetical protein